MDNQNNGSTSMSYIMNTKNWWGPLTFILIISLLGVGMIGYQTYIDAPPMAGFSDEKNNQIFDQKTIERGQEVFHKYALMEYGSFFGDGAQRGPDFTAEALHQTSLAMSDFYIDEFKTIKGTQPDEFEIKQINEKVKQELKINRYNKSTGLVVLSPAQVYAHQRVQQYYVDIFINNKGGAGSLPSNYIKTREGVKDLSSFCFWGAWVCVA